MSSKEASCALRVKDLGVYQNGRWLFRGLTFCLHRGDFLAVVGPSGVGKSTLLHALAGMVEPQEGSVEYFWREGETLRPYEARRHLGIVFQQFMLSRNADVLTNVLCGKLGSYPWWKTLWRFPKRDREVAFQILCDLGLQKNVYRRTGDTSGGEQQRIAIARSLFQDPKLHLADEPVSNLDLYLTGRVLGLLRLEADLKQKGVICVLHNPDLVKRFADHALSLHPTDPRGWKVRALRGGDRETEALPLSCGEDDR